MGVSLSAKSGIAGAFFLIAVIAFLFWQINGLMADVITLEKRNSEVTAANAVQRSVIEALQRQESENNSMVEAAARKISEMSARNRNLENNLRKATSEQKYNDFKYSRDVSLALCLRWLNAEGRLPGGYSADHAGSLVAGRNDPVTAFCAAWPLLTAEDTADYIGDLIDHAGRMKVRAWAATGKE